MFSFSICNISVHNATTRSYFFNFKWHNAIFPKRAVCNIFIFSNWSPLDSSPPFDPPKSCPIDEDVCCIDITDLVPKCAKWYFLKASLYLPSFSKALPSLFIVSNSSVEGIFPTIIKFKRSNIIRGSVMVGITELVGRGVSVGVVGVGDVDDSRPAWLSFFRVFMMGMTVVAILAVDFNIFPRRFAKTETYGISLMDMGVGAMVFAAGFVSVNTMSSKRNTINKKMWVSSHLFKRATPLLLLGFARLIAVKATAYHEVVAEYGVHWNFFFTMAILFFVHGFVSNLEVLNPNTPLLACAFTMTAYQYALSVHHLDKYILEAPRENLFSKNREGILGLIGFTVIFEMASFFGKSILRKKLSPIAFLPHFITLFAAVFFGHAVGGIQISRRMVNMPYVLVTLIFSLSLVVAFSFAEKVFRVYEESALVKVLNPALLEWFLCANVCTGLVNLTTNTRAASNGVAAVILLAYLLITMALAVYTNSIFRSMRGKL
eukprot:m.29252 g.29252  ORF g.29252 m.29252 type:complete len:489 (-) comp6135_c0_seq1:321-1787(-)